MRLIAFNGSMGVGKSTAIELLKNELGEDNIKLVKFAGHLYDIQEYIYNKISPVYKKPEGFVKDRFLLQFLGTDWGRDRISKNLWVDLWKAEVMNILDDPDKIVVCDDCRFDNEAEVVKSMGGTIIKITSNKNVERIDTKAGIVNHASEQGINSKYIDYHIENNYTIEAYREQLRALYKTLVGDKSLSNLNKKRME